MKRIFDFLFSALGLVVLAVPLLVLAWLVRRNLGSPVLFRQVRAGRHGAPFLMMKFRSMNEERGPDGELKPDTLRLTSFGKFLRRTSLDELPELWNVLCGDMSLVGPRPLVMEYLPLYTPEQGRRHEVLPGITGWAQVNGRNNLSWEDKFNLDVWYVDNRTFWLDIKIICKTIKVVFGKKDISPPNSEIMERFLGVTQTKVKSDNGGK
jgi:lipopolysaccharide/colanic/teichoic acid biosynthesis glycosyltransferase